MRKAKLLSNKWVSSKPVRFIFSSQELSVCIRSYGLPGERVKEKSKERFVKAKGSGRAGHVQGLKRRRFPAFATTAADRSHCCCNTSVRTGFLGLANLFL